MTLVPALILILPERRYRWQAAGAERERGGRLPKILAAVARLDIRRRRSIFAVAGLLVLVSLAALPKIEADTSVIARTKRMAIPITA
jgi:predicted RND superfamily exporter protein